MAPASTHSTDHELSQLEALPTEILEMQLEQLPVSTLLRAMSVSRRVAAVASNALRFVFQTVLTSIQNERVKILLTFAPPAFADASVLCAYAATDGSANDITKLYSRFCPESRVPKTLRPAPEPAPFICGTSLDDGEAFTQFKVVVKTVVSSDGYWIPVSTTIFDGTLRISQEWLSRGTPEVLWADQHETVGLRLLPRARRANTAHGAQFYDLEVQELHLRTTRFLRGVEEEERVQGDGRLVVLRRVVRNE